MLGTPTPVQRLLNDSLETAGWTWMPAEPGRPAWYNSLLDVWLTQVDAGCYRLERRDPWKVAHARSPKRKAESLAADLAVQIASALKKFSE